ncbi:MAG: HNH endonuclease [Bacteroidales bacterium]|jgi:hypothetical protein|nr:HNH endonuclease [Bacteroidales bacterium]
MDKNLDDIMTQFVDYLLPELTPYQTTMYLLLLRKSLLENGSREIRIGKRTLADFYGKGSRGEKTNYAHISKQLKGLEQNGCISIGDTTQDGTLYIIKFPNEIPIVMKKITSKEEPKIVEDFFTDPEKRRLIFERDKWICYYCGEKVTLDNATLDHLHPQHLGGTHLKENLKTSCLTCNSIKSGMTYEEAAAFILKSIQERRARKNQ